jgi:hypothetical protein
MWGDVQREKGKCGSVEERWRAGREAKRCKYRKPGSSFTGT